MYRLHVLTLSLCVLANAGFAQTARRVAPQVSKPAAADGMTNADVIKMVKAGLADDIVLSSIGSASKRIFDLSPDGLIELKAAGVNDRIILAMQNNGKLPAVSPAAPVPAAAWPQVVPAAGAGTQSGVTPAIPSEDRPVVPEIGIYYKRENAWVDLLPEVVNWKTGGALKHALSLRIIKGDVNGSINGPTSRNVLKAPIEILVYTPDGTAITEYQLLRLRNKSDRREFRTVTGGVLHVSGGATRDLVPFEFKKVAARTYTLILPNLGAGEYGVLSPGAASSSNASAQLGKIYSFRVE